MSDRTQKPKEDLTRDQVDRLDTMEFRLRAFGLSAKERRSILDEIKDVYRQFEKLGEPLE